MRKVLPTLAHTVLLFNLLGLLHEASSAAPIFSLGGLVFLSVWWMIYIVSGG